MTGALVLLTAVALSAPVPTVAGAERPAPRARLTGTLTVPAYIEQVLGLADGKHLVLRCRDGVVRVVRRDQFASGEPAAKPVAEFKLPGRCQGLAVTPDGTELYAEVPTHGRVSAEPQVLFWATKRLADGGDLATPDRVLSLDTHHASGATLTAAGRHLLAMVTDPQPVGTPAVRLDHFSTKTGDRVGEFARFDDPAETYAGHALDPKTTRLFVQLQTPDQTAVRCLNATTGKQLWDRQMGERPYRGLYQNPVPSPDGRLLGTVAWHTVMRPAGVPQPGQPVQLQQINRVALYLMTAKTGEPVELTADEYSNAVLYGFSADGRLLAARVWDKHLGTATLVVWDTASGKPVKTWTASGDLFAAFAPAGHDLLTADREQTTEQVQSTIRSTRENWSEQPQLVRMTSKTTLGIWDLTPLVK